MILTATRIHGHGWREQIAAAQEVIGPHIMQRLNHVQIVAGIDPVFAGIHNYEQTANGRSYRKTACCCYPTHMLGPLERRVTTIILPTPDTGWNAVKTIVHEYGHALDQHIGLAHDCDPVTAYAHTDRQEAFAEAFTSWVWGSLPGYDRPSDADHALFESLA
jgi:hypothetical protein